jgi:hypothetical protein
MVAQGQNQIQLQNLVGRQAARGLRLAGAYRVADMVCRDGLSLGDNCDGLNRDDEQQKVPEASNHKFSLLESGDGYCRRDESAFGVVEFWGNGSTCV